MRDAVITAARKCDVLPAVGSSPTVRPAAGLCLEAVGRGARLVIINAAETPYDGLADAVLRLLIGEALPESADLLLGTGRDRAAGRGPAGGGAAQTGCDSAADRSAAGG